MKSHQHYSTVRHRTSTRTHRHNKTVEKLSYYYETVYYRRITHARS